MQAGALGKGFAGRFPDEIDGVDVWSTISAGNPSPREEIVYNIEPYRGAVRKGDWKLVWLALLPPNVELFDLSKDPSEATNLADQNPDKVKELQSTDSRFGQAGGAASLPDGNGEFGAGRQTGISGHRSRR